MLFSSSAYTIKCYLPTKKKKKTKKEKKPVTEATIVLFVILLIMATIVSNGFVVCGFLARDMN